MSDALKNGVIDYIKSNKGYMSYETMSELAVIYAMRMDKTYCGLFFNTLTDKFL